MMKQGPDCKRRELLRSIGDFVIRYVLEQIKINKAKEGQHICSHLLSTPLDILASGRKLHNAKCAEDTAH